MLSAHGSAPEVVAAARASGGYVVDAVCPLVTKVHHEVKVRAGKGYQIVYVGHEGHEEAVGTMAVAPDSIHRVESVDDVDALPDMDQPVALLAQTTLSHRDWAAVAERTAERYPDLWRPGRSDLCFATTNRQSALGEIASRCDAVVVIGSANSSNTRALERLARESGAPAVYRINGPDELPDRPARRGRRHRRRVGARGARRRRHRPPRARRRASRRCASPTRTSTSLRRASCATCSTAVDVLATLVAGGQRARPPRAARPRPGRQRRARPAQPVTARRDLQPALLRVALGAGTVAGDPGLDRLALGEVAEHADRRCRRRSRR